MKAKVKKPHASERTISLFTGKTDQESDYARDGSQPGTPYGGRKRRRTKEEVEHDRSNRGGWKYKPGPEKLDD